MHHLARDCWVTVLPVPNPRVTVVAEGDGKRVSSTLPGYERFREGESLRAGSGCPTYQR